MAIKISWLAFSNVSFRGEDIVDISKEEFEDLSDIDKVSIVLDLCGFEWGYEEVK